MVIREANDTNITTSSFLVIQSFCKGEFILIFLQEHRKKVMKIGSSPKKGTGRHFNILIKVLIVINNFLKLKVDLSDASLHILRKYFNSSSIDICPFLFPGLSNQLYKETTSVAYDLFGTFCFSLLKLLTE